MWELSPLYRHSILDNSIFSPNNSTFINNDNNNINTETFLISSNVDRIVLRNSITLQIIKTWKLSSITTNSKPSSSSSSSTTPDSPISSISISPVSPHHILAYSSKSNLAWILDPRLDEPIAKIDIGAEGANGMCWSGLGDTVMIWSAHHLRLTLYRIATPSPALFILNPKLSCPHGFSFRPQDSRFLAIAERHSSRDHVGIYDCTTWKLLRYFPLPNTTSDIADLSWSPCGNYIAIWESLTDYILHIYTPDGRHLSTFTPYARLAHNIATSTTFKSLKNSKQTPSPAALDGSTITGKKVEEKTDLGSKGEKERMREERSTDSWVGLGIRVVEWSRDSQWIAVGGWDGKIRILSKISWLPIAELAHPLKISSTTLVWQEPKDWIEKTRGKGIIAFETQSLPYSPPFIRADLNRPNPKMGISHLSWSPSSRWIASYSQSYPTTIWIFSFSIPTSNTTPFIPKLHSILISNSSIKSFTWQPLPSTSSSLTEQKREMLAIVSGEKGFMTWKEPILRPETSESWNEGRSSENEKNGERGEELDGIAEGVGIPARTEFAPVSLKFSPSGDALILADKETYAVAYPVSDETDQDSNELAERTWIEE